MPKTKPLARDVTILGGKAERRQVKANPLGNRAERRAAAKRIAKTTGKGS